MTPLENPQHAAPVRAIFVFSVCPRITEAQVLNRLS
jgi:hypothetical protein